MTTKHGFTGITSEGGLLPTDFLADLADPKANIEGLDPVTFRLSPGERIGEQVNRSWNRLKGCWTNFQRSIAAKQPGEPTTTETRERWLLPLFQELDFGRLTAVRPIEIDGKSYPVSHGWDSVPIHLVGSHVDLDRRTPGAVGAARMSPHSLVQQVLNASEDRMWGIISNGFTLRLLRDNVTLTRIAYIEWDLQAIFDGDLYPEFFLLWLVCHQSRFEIPPGGRPHQCWLEKWKKQAEDKGLRALENLRPGVEKAIAELGAGFVSHKANTALRSKLGSGQLTTQDLYRQILRVVYRMLFLFVAEDRGLLHPPLPGDEAGKNAFDAALNARRRYRDFYSIGRVRDLTLHRAGTPHPDLGQVFQLISSKLGSDTGCPELALPALGSFLWSPEATSDLNECLLSNRHFLQAVHSLAYVRDGNVRRTIDYKNLGSEELGSVYESLLELHPIVNADIGTFELQTAAGHERKTSGSYYTHDSLVQCLLDSALEPVIAQTIRGKEGRAAADALLKLKFCDPAVGSGHFLIAAGHRLAKRVAAARTGEEEPSPEAVRTALRDVIGRCLYGVDINPMAAELCRVSLWLEALEPGKPLSFLDHHIRVGNSLLGATPELIVNGIPDEAFNAIEGDDKKACTILKKRNKAERKGIGGLFVAEDAGNQEALRRTAFALESINDDTPDTVRRKAAAFEESQHSYNYLAAKRLADTWCAAFVIRKTFSLGTTQPVGLTQGNLTDLAQGHTLPSDLVAEVDRLAATYSFFHWHLVFPEVVANGGFDVNLGNPPWERVKLQEKEWFAERRPDIANAPNAASRKRLIEALQTEDPMVYRQFQEALRQAEGESHLMRNSGIYPLCGRGDINLYAVFAERMRAVLNAKGYFGAVLPSGITTDDTTKLFFQHTVEVGALVRVLDFENTYGFFPQIDRNTKFCLFTCGSTVPSHGRDALFVSGVKEVTELHDPAKQYSLTRREIALINPNTRTCPLFRSSQDAELAKAIYGRVPVLQKDIEPSDDSWRITFYRMFDMSNDSGLFHEALPQSTSPPNLIAAEDGYSGMDAFVSVYEGKMFHQFNHRFASALEADAGQRLRGGSEDTSLDELRNPLFTPHGRYWVNRHDLPQWSERCTSILAFRRVGGVVANVRTMVSAILPQVACGDSVFVIQTDASREKLALCAMLNSFALDYVLRQKMSGINLNYFIVKQLPVLPPSTYAQPCPWASDQQSAIDQKKLQDWLLPRVLELTYTAWDLEPFAQDYGWNGPPFRWDEERRFILRCELDAAFFHLYLGLEDEWRHQPESLNRAFPTPRHAVDYIMDAFPIVKRRDEEKHGEYRTKRVILEIYDEMTESIRTGKPYQTCLAPPPGPPTDETGPSNWPLHIHAPKEVSNAQ